MEDKLEINGIEYIKKSKMEEMERDLENIKKMANSMISQLNVLVGNQPAAQPTEQQTKRKYNLKSADEPLKLRKAAEQEYKIKTLDKDGNFYSIHNRKFIFKIQDVLAIRKEYSNKTTNGDVVKLAKSLDMDVTSVQRIIYNLDIHVFDNFIKQWLKSANDIEIVQKTTEVQNNPQKRKEFGYS